MRTVRSQVVERMKKYDLVVIGAGSAGYAAAKAGAELGLETALVEAAEEMGGLCMLRGCMPSKTLIETANRMREIRNAAEFGIDVREAKVEMDRLQRRRSDFVSEFQQDRVGQIKGGDFDLLRGRAHFEGPDQLSISGASTQRVRFRSAIIATGSKPFVPGIKGLSESDFWLSDDALQARKIPEHLLILGGGVIGCEMAHCYEGLGSKVSIINRSEHLLSDMPPEASELVEEASQSRGIELLLETKVHRVVRADSKVILELEKGDGSRCEIEGTHLLVATGRMASLEKLKLEEADIDHNRKGIAVNEFDQTSAERIFAVGDCADGLQVVHQAVIRGQQAARNCNALLQENKLQPADLKPDIVAVFCHPEVIHIGPPFSVLNEQSDVESKSFSLPEMGKAMICGIHHGTLKVFYQRETNKLLAATGVGPGVIDFSHGLAVAIRLGMTLEEFLKVPHYHPTLAEAWTYFESE